MDYTRVHPIIGLDIWGVALEVSVQGSKEAE